MTIPIPDQFRKGFAGADPLIPPSDLANYVVYAQAFPTGSARFAGQLFVFSEAVPSGLQNYVDLDGSTALASAAKHEVARFDGTNWRKLGSFMALANSGGLSLQEVTSIVNAALNALISDDTTTIPTIDAGYLDYSGRRGPDSEFGNLDLTPSPNVLVPVRNLTAAERMELAAGASFTLRLALTHRLYSTSGFSPAAQARITISNTDATESVTNHSLPSGVLEFPVAVRLGSKAQSFKVELFVSTRGLAAAGRVTVDSADLAELGSHEVEFETLINRLANALVGVERGAREEADAALGRRIDDLESRLSRQIADATQASDAVRQFHAALGLGHEEDTAYTDWAATGRIAIPGAGAWHDGEVRNEIPGSDIVMGSPSSPDNRGKVAGGTISIGSPRQTAFRPFLLGFSTNIRTRSIRQTDNQPLLRVRKRVDNQLANLLVFNGGLGLSAIQRSGQETPHTTSHDEAIYSNAGRAHESWHGADSGIGSRTTGEASWVVPSNDTYTVHVALLANGNPQGPEHSFQVTIDRSVSQAQQVRHIAFDHQGYARMLTVTYSFNAANNHLSIAVSGLHLIDQVDVYVTHSVEVTTYDRVIEAPRYLIDHFSAAYFPTVDWYSLFLFYEGANGNLHLNVVTRLNDQIFSGRTPGLDLGFSPDEFIWGELILGGNFFDLRRVDFGLFDISTTLAQLPTQGAATRQFTGGAQRVGNALRFGIGQAQPQGMASDGNSLYMVDNNSDALYMLSAETGLAIRIGSAVQFGVGESSPSGLAFDPAGDGTLYLVGSTSDALFTLDRSTGVATRVGSAVQFGVSETTPGGLAFHSGALYMSGTINDVLYRIDTATGVATRVGTATQFGVGEGGMAGLFSDGTTLYGVGQSGDRLYSLNTTTGAATRIGNLADFDVNEGFPSGAAYHKENGYLVGFQQNALFRLTKSLGNTLPSFITHGLSDSDWMWTLLTEGTRRDFSFDYIEVHRKIKTRMFGPTPIYEAVGADHVSFDDSGNIRLTIPGLDLEDGDVYLGSIIKFQWRNPSSPPNDTQSMLLSVNGSVPHNIKVATGGSRTQNNLTYGDMKDVANFRFIEVIRSGRNYALTGRPTIFVNDLSSLSGAGFH